MFRWLHQTNHCWNCMEQLTSLTIIQINLFVVIVWKCSDLEVKHYTWGSSHERTNKLCISWKNMNQCLVYYWKLIGSIFTRRKFKRGGESCWDTHESARLPRGDVWNYELWEVKFLGHLQHVGREGPILDEDSQCSGALRGIGTTLVPKWFVRVKLRRASA